MTAGIAAKPKARKQHGWRTYPGLGRIETMELVARLRRFRGRKTIGEMLVILGIPNHRCWWLSILQLCRTFEITTNDPDDPDYYYRTVRRDMKALREQEIIEAREDAQRQRAKAACAAVRAVLREQIAQAHAEWRTAPPYKVGKLEW